MSLSSPVRFGPETILFLARSLDHGGAERQLVVLAKGLASRGHAVMVAVFYGGGVYEAELAEAGIQVFDLGKRSRWDILPFLNRLLVLLRRERPAVVHGYLAVPNLVATIVKPLVPHIRIVWGIRASNMDLSRYDWLARQAYWLERHLARFADCIIANSQAGKGHAVATGFPEDKIFVIPNGIDTGRFYFDADGRRRLRAEWEIGDSDTLIGISARLDLMKGYETMLEAAALLARDWPNVRFVCVGDGAPAYRRNLVRLGQRLGIDHLIIWAGVRNDMPAVYSAIDIATSASHFGEGFSNAIAEAMSCERPCVVTDVGDSALIVGEAGLVVPAQDARALARGWASLMAMPELSRLAAGRHARQRIEAHFTADRMVERTIQALNIN